MILFSFGIWIRHGIFKKKTAFDLDQIDYFIIQVISSDLRKILLSIYNDIFAQSLFFHSWRASIVFISKADSKGLPHCFNVLSFQSPGEDDLS